MNVSVLRMMIVTAVVVELPHADQQRDATFGKISMAIVRTLS